MQPLESFQPISALGLPRMLPAVMFTICTSRASAASKSANRLQSSSSRASDGDLPDIVGMLCKVRTSLQHSEVLSSSAHLCGILGALPLLRHGRLEAGGVDAEARLRRDLRRDLQREAVAVVQQERAVARHLQRLPVLRRTRLVPDVLRRSGDSVKRHQERVL